MMRRWYGSMMFHHTELLFLLNVYITFLMSWGSALYMIHCVHSEIHVWQINCHWFVSFRCFFKKMFPPKDGWWIVKPWINHSFLPFVSALFFRIMTLNHVVFRLSAFPDVARRVEFFRLVLRPESFYKDYDIEANLNDFLFGVCLD